MDIEGLLPGIVVKPWGHEHIVRKTKKYVVKEMFVKAGHQLSLQYHNMKVETIFLLDGDAFILLPKKYGGLGDAFLYVAKSSIDMIEAIDKFEMSVMEPYYIKNQTIHRLGANKDSLFLEVSTTELKDVVRLKDDYGRGR